MEEKEAERPPMEMIDRESKLAASPDWYKA